MLLVKLLQARTWNILILFCITIITLEFDRIGLPNFYYPILEQIGLIFPLIIFIVYLSETLKKNKFRSNSIFQRIFCSVILVFFISALLGFINDHANSDLKAWWPLSLYITFFYSVIFSSIYSVSLLIFHFNQKEYNFTIYLIILIIFLSLKFLPSSINLLFVNNFDTLTFLLLILLIVHLMFMIIYKLIKNIFKS